MWKYTISLLFMVQFASAQVVLKEPERQVFVRLGADLSRAALKYISDFDQKGFEMSLDGEVKYRYFPTLEGGYSEINQVNDSLNYHSDGGYFRIGFDYNMLNYKQRFDRNIFFIGARYGYTSYSQQVLYGEVSNEWGTINIAGDPEKLNAHWFEGVIGLRGEILKNLYMGYTIRVKQMLMHSEYGPITPYWIPGFGKANKSITVGMSYSIFYAFPIKNPKPDFEE
jgi:hypothetical protein